MPRGSVSLMFMKIKETGRGRHRIPPRFFFCKSRDSWRKCMREALSPSHLRGVWASSDPSALRASGSDSRLRVGFAPQGRIRPDSPEMTGGTYISLPLRSKSSGNVAVDIPNATNTNLTASNKVLICWSNGESRKKMTSCRCNVVLHWTETEQR